MFICSVPSYKLYHVTCNLCFRTQFFENMTLENGYVPRLSIGKYGKPGKTFPKRPNFLKLPKVPLGKLLYRVAVPRCYSIVVVPRYSPDNWSIIFPFAQSTGRIGSVGGGTSKEGRLHVVHDQLLPVQYSTPKVPLQAALCYKRQLRIESLGKVHFRSLIFPLHNRQEK